MGTVWHNLSEKIIKDLPDDFPGCSGMRVKIPDVKGLGIIFIPEAIFSPEGGNAAFDGNTGACKGHTAFGGSDDIGRLLIGIRQDPSPQRDWSTALRSRAYCAEYPRGLK